MPEDEKTTILIVDDKENNIYALEQMLARPNRHFIGATSGNDALKIVLNQNIDLIILDVQMPDMDGFEVAQLVKSKKQTRDIPIIFATAEKKEHHFMIKGFEEGAIDYLYKPLDKDITEAKVAVLLKLHFQKKLLEQKNAELEKYELLINNSADIICIINAETLQFEEVNEAVNSLLGYTPKEMKGTSLLTYIPEKNRLKAGALGEKSKPEFSFETQLKTKKGKAKWFHWNIVSKGGLWFANARDVSEAKKAEEEICQLNADLKLNIAQLEAANKELDSFSYSVSHDLRAPLRSINGYASIIQEEYHSSFNEEQKRLFGIIQQNAKKMGMLIDDLLEFSRLGRKEIKKSEVHTGDIVKKIVAEMIPLIKRPPAIEVRDLPNVKGDYKLLYQVFVNLVSNAIKYSSKSENPLIEIGAVQKELKDVFYVKDNGAGFSMEYSHKLFGVFQRLHNHEDFEGTGVGLAIVKRIVSKHGGEVWAEGESGKGATFYFSLPVDVRV